MIHCSQAAGKHIGEWQDADAGWQENDWPCGGIAVTVAVSAGGKETIITIYRRFLQSHECYVPSSLCLSTVYVNLLSQF